MGFAHKRRDYDLWKTEYFNLHYEIARAIEAKVKEKNGEQCWNANE